MTAVLALTLSAPRFGWAVGSVSGRITSDRASLPVATPDRPGIPFQALRRWLTETKRTAGDLALVLVDEAPPGTAITHAGLFAIAAAWADHHGITIETAPAATVAHALTGNPDAHLSALVAALRSVGQSPTTREEVRALAILLWSLTR
jgi:hypothetical protein